MSDYTPTTDDVREDFAFPWSPDQIGDKQARLEAFDRWLANLKADVWDEGEEAGMKNQANWDGWRDTKPPITNPYREEQS